MTSEQNKRVESEDKISSHKNPYQSNAPWPTMRGDIRNSGCLKNLKWENPGIAPKAIHFRTKNAIFSTPIIDSEEQLFVGSADHKFYAIDPHEGIELWEHDVGEIIDSAGCVGKDDTVYIAAGDGKIHAYTPDGKEKWTYNVLKRKKEQFTFSTNYWFEANIVLGPDDAIYVANDDFFLYKLSLDGKPIWGYRTGFLIWSAPSFGKDETVYLAGFDHLLYALDMNTGRLKWKTNLGGSLVSSPAISKDGIIYQGSFSGKLSAVDGANGKVKWKVDTGSHIYASAAIAPDNVVYFGSTNGTFYAVDGKTGNIKWTYYIGDAIRSSASIGPDPEEKEPYLIYFGGGDGVVYAIDPNGKVRWSYNTLDQALNTDYPNINASIALGHNGLAVASSTGDVIWLSYDYYLKKDAPGITIGEELATKEKGVLWHYVAPGGRLHLRPLKEEIQDIDPTNIISLRLLIHDSGNIFPAILIPASVKIDPKPDFKHRFEIQSDRNTINLIPNKILKPQNDYALEISTSYIDREGQTASIKSTVQLRTRMAPQETSIISEKNTTFKIIHMAVPQPRIIPSLDQIGLASLTIPFSIVESDPERKTFVAWAVHKFGEEGVPQKRITLYAFSGRIEDDFFLMESRNCLFEITSFTIPLDLFRISGFLKPGGTVATGGSLLIEKFLGLNLISLFRMLAGDTPIAPRELLNYLRMGGVVQFMKAAFQFFPALLRQVAGNTWDSWGLINHAKKLVGVGTFKMATIPNEKDSIVEGIEVYKFEAVPSKKRVVAEYKISEKDPEWSTLICILLVDKTTGRTLPFNYNSSVKYKELRNGKKRAVLSIPKKDRAKTFRAYLMADIYPIKKIEF
ncbi:MAG: PQQ-like beta-propeller repeat protein [Candidatus Helarchaeota archaeon]|nr:PQQ-like beta-propeller repeat protein [Candidatus Helarchaeota archaeon]